MLADFPPKLIILQIARRVKSHQTLNAKAVQAVEGPGIVEHVIADLAVKRKWILEIPVELGC